MKIFSFMIKNQRQLIPTLSFFTLLMSGCVFTRHDKIIEGKTPQPEQHVYGGDKAVPSNKINVVDRINEESHGAPLKPAEALPEIPAGIHLNPPPYSHPAEDISPSIGIISKKLENTKISTLDFRNEKLSNILTAITAVTDVNFAVKDGKKTGDRIIMPDYLKDVLEEEYSKKDEDNKDLFSERISIYLKDTTLKTALDVLCRNNGLRYSIEEGFILFSNKKTDIRLVYNRTTGTQDDNSESLGFFSSMELKGVMLGRALNAVSKKTGINIICKPWLENIEIDLSLKNVPLRTAIEVLCKKYNLWYREQDEAIHIMHAYDLEREVPVDVGIRTEIYNLRYASAPQVADAISSVMGDRVEYVLPTQLKSYEHLKLSDLDDDEGKIETQESDTESSKEIDTPDLKKEYLTSDKIKALLGTKLDLKLTESDVRWINKQLGFALMSIFLRNNAILVSSSDGRILDEIRSLIYQLDTPTPQVLIECRILNVTLTDDFSSFFQISEANYDRNGGGGTDSKILTGSMLDASTGINAVYRIINDKWDLDLKMEMLQKDGLLNTIATPMVVAAQNSEAEVTSGEVNVPLFSGVNYNPPTYDEEGNMTTQGYASPEYNTADLVGTQLRITPQVNEDRTVTLKIYLVQSGINSKGAEVYYAGFDSSGNPNANWTSSTVSTLRSNALQTIAVVPEGSTLALGGLIEEEENLTERKVPILGDIPLLGFFFKNESKNKTRTEMVFLLTPHILMSPNESDRVTREALKGSEHPVIKENKKYMFEYNETWKKLNKN